MPSLFLLITGGILWRLIVQDFGELPVLLQQDVNCTRGIDCLCISGCWGAFVEALCGWNSFNISHDRMLAACLHTPTPDTQISENIHAHACSQTQLHTHTLMHIFRFPFACENNYLLITARERKELDYQDF